MDPEEFSHFNQETQEEQGCGDLTLEEIKSLINNILNIIIKNNNRSPGEDVI